MRNPYEVLLLPKDSPPDIVNYAYRLLARKWHPDINPNYREEAERRMKEINEAYETIKRADVANPRWNYLDYEFRSYSEGDKHYKLHDMLAKAFGYGPTAELDCWCAEIRRVQRREVPETFNLFDVKAFGAHVSKYLRSDFYLYADPHPLGYRTNIEIELEDLLIAVARKKISKIHPLYVRPTLQHYGIESVIEPRIDEFCDMLSQPEVDTRYIIRQFKLGEILPEDDKVHHSSKTLWRLELQLRRWIDPGFSVEETPEGGLRISYLSERDEQEEFKLTRKDYTFVQCLVFGGKLLEGENL